MTSDDLATSLRRARNARGLTIRQLAEAAGVAPGTAHRYERSDPGVITPQTLRKIAEALGMRAVQTDDGTWSVRPMEAATTTVATTGGNTVVADGDTLLVLRVPPGFLEGLSAEQRREVEADGLLEVMRLAREAQRRANT